jgi:hypothetical protein
LSFSEPLDESSEIRVFDHCERRLDDADTQVSLNDMSVALRLGPTGTYTVAYQAVGLSGTLEEAYSFTVLHGGPSCDGTSGHGGHGGDGDGDGDGGGGDGGHGGSGHSGSGGSGDHTDGDHSGTGDHSENDHSETDHSVMGNREHKRDHSKMRHGKHANMRHGKNKKHDKHDQNNPPQAGPGAPLVPQPGAEAILAALGFATLLGVAGGWVLRVSE